MRNVRQHVNPLGLYYMTPRARPVERPAQLSADCRVEVELGCADADFSFALAERERDTFVVGLEIREALVERNRAKAVRLGLANLAFSYVNLNVDLGRVFTAQSVDRFHLLFPDPWFKARHHKRRVVDAALCRCVHSQLKPGGELHIATDIYELALDAMAQLEDVELDDLGFDNLAGEWCFIRENPCAVESRREGTTRARGQRVWRLRYRKPTG